LSQRIAVVDVTGGKNPEARIVLANPEIVHAEGKFGKKKAAYRFRVFGVTCCGRNLWTIKAQNAKGEAFEIRGENLLARAFCHEIDHLNRNSFLQHLSMLKREPESNENQEAQEARRVVSAGSRPLGAAAV